MKSSVIPKVTCFVLAAGLCLLCILVTLLMLLANMNIRFSSTPQLGMFIAGWGFVLSGIVATFRLLRHPRFHSLWYLVVPIICITMIFWLGTLPENQHLMH